MKVKDIFTVLSAREIYISFEEPQKERHDEHEHFYIYSAHDIETIIEKYGNKIVKTLLPLWENIMLIAVE